MVKGIKDFEFQNDCVDFLIQKTAERDSKKVITVKAPTGAGKTIILIKYIDEYLKYGFDLVLSGHTHGGQWRLPFFDIGLYSYGQGLFPKYSGGKYEFINSALIVGRGLCKNIAVMRLYNPPEIVIVNIYSM